MSESGTGLSVKHNHGNKNLDEGQRASRTKKRSTDSSDDSSTDNGEIVPKNGMSPTAEDSGVMLGTPSSQQSPPLAGDESKHSDKQLKTDVQSTKKASLWRAMITMAVLCLVNTLNYMDRYTLPAVLNEVMEHFSIDFAQTGLLQTVFVCSYMVVSPVFGYLGDHHNRVYIIAGGVAFWSVVTLASSFVPADQFALFVLTRALVGVGEASYVTVAPSLIGDLFAGESRSTAIAVFSLTTPLGSGLGYVVGGFVAQLTGNWQWALRVTPVLGALCVLVALTIVREPQRGAADRRAAALANAQGKPDADATELELLNQKETRNSKASSISSEHETKRRNFLSQWFADVMYLLRIMTYLLVVLGFTSVCFVAGSVSWFGPSFAFIAFQLNSYETGAPVRSNSTVSLLFGIVTCVAGVLGVIVGVTLAKVLRKVRNLDRRADALVCGTGLLLSAPLLCATLFVARYSFYGTWFAMILALVSLFVTWPLVTDMMLFVIEPHRRASASGLEMLATHLFGDASSPYILGALADALRVHFSSQSVAAANGTQITSAAAYTDMPLSSTFSPFDSTANSTLPVYTNGTMADPAKFHALQYSLAVNTVIALLGGTAFLFAFLVILRDRKRLLVRLERQASPHA